MLLRETDCGGALKVAERIRRTMEIHHFLAREGYGLGVTTCIGVASFPSTRGQAHAARLGGPRDVPGQAHPRNVVYVATPAAEEVVKRSGAA